MSKIKIEDIKAQLDVYNWKVISTEYKNLDTEMTFQCDEGHTVYSTWRKIRNRRECPICLQNKYKTNGFTVIPKKKDTKRVLGLDQATRISGWSIYDNDDLVQYGTFETGLNDEAARIHSIKEWLINMINLWEPDLVGIEGLQYQVNMGVTVFEKLARLQGVLIEALYELNIPFQICPTNTWRHYCGVKGKTRSDKKRSMQLKAKEWFDISISDDEADAIGIGKYISENFKIPLGEAQVNIEIWE